MIPSLPTEEHSRILDALPAQLAILGSDGTILAVNASWKRFAVDNSLAAPAFGVGMKYLDLCMAMSGSDTEGAKAAADGIQKVLRGAVDLFEIEHPCMYPAKRRWLHVTATPVQRGEDHGAVVMHVDITGRKLSEERLKRTARQLLHAQQVAGVGSWERDILEHTSSWSDQLIRILGLDPQAIRPSLELYLQCLHPDDRAVVCDVLEKAAAGSGPINYEARVIQPDGTLRFIQARGEMILGPEGKPARTIGTVQDITERKMAEMERARLLESEQAARAQAEGAIERLRALQSVSDATLAHMALDDMLAELLSRVRSILGAETSSVLLVSEDGTVLRERAAQGFSSAWVGTNAVPLGQGIAGQIAARCQPMLVEDLAEVEHVRPFHREGIRSLLGVPLVVEGHAIGVLDVGSIRPRRFADEDVSLLQLVADRVAPAIDRARLFEEVREGRERLRALSRRLVEIQEAERREIARELHDEVGQLLTGLKLLIETGDRERLRMATASKETGAGPSQAREEVVASSGVNARGPGEGRSEIASLVNEIMVRVRDLSMNLRPAMLDDLGLFPALRWHFGRYTAQTRVRVAFETSGPEGRLPPEIEIASFRIVQEALTNVARHAGVQEVTVRIDVQPEALRLRIEDPGIGFDASRLNPGTSGGITGMLERARLVGGHLSIESRAGEGARILAEIPISTVPRG